MSVQFELDRDATVEAIVFLVSKRLPELTKWKLCKLLFLADKLHLVRYGRPITGDTYFAVKLGPIPSNALNALNQEKQPISVSLQKLIDKGNQKYPEYFLKSSFLASWNALSHSDLEVLEEVAREFGYVGFEDLTRVVHVDPAYKEAWERRGDGGREEMRFEAFFSRQPASGAFDAMIENAAIRRALH